MSSEEVLALGPHAGLIGVYTPRDPATPAGAADLAVVMLNPGLIHHVGPHRMHVKLARALAGRGIAAARIDFAAVGDSLPYPGAHSPADLMQLEMGAVLEDLARRGHRRFVLFGLCSGALAAREFAARDGRVCGVVLVNSGSNVDSDEFAQATTRFYLRRSLWKPRAWWNLVTGRVKYGLLFGSLAAAASAAVRGLGGRRAVLDSSDARTRLRVLVDRGIAVLAVLSDRHAEGFAILEDQLDDLRAAGAVTVACYAQADHLFTSLAAERTLIEQVCRWVGEQADVDASTAAAATPRGAGV